MTTGIFTLFRGLYFESNNEFGNKDRLWADTFGAMNRCRLKRRPTQKKPFLHGRKQL